MALSDTSMQLYGADRPYARLRDVMSRTEFVQVVAGPPGSMKTTLIHRAANEAALHVQVLDIDHQSNEKLQETLRKLGAHTLGARTCMNATLWLVLGAELLPNSAAVWKDAAAGGQRIILEMTDVPPSFRSGRGKLDVLYLDRLSEANVRAFLRDIGMATGTARAAAAERAQGDLHQAGMVANGWRAGEGKDTVAHLWFDTKQLVNPGRCSLPADRVDLGWVQHNALSRMSDLAHATAFAETCAFADSCVHASLGELPGTILQLALKQSKRSFGDRVERPPCLDARGRGGSMQRKHMLRKQKDELWQMLSAKRGSGDAKPRQTSPADNTSTLVPQGAAKEEKQKRVERDSRAAKGKKRGRSEESNARSAGARPAAGCQEREGGAAASLSAAAAAVIYDGAPQFRIVKRAAVSTHGMSVMKPPTLTPGEACANNCKGRPIVAGHCKSFDDYDALAASPAVRGCVVGKFENGFFALVFKHPSYELKALACFAISKCRLAPSLVRQTFELFGSTAHRGDVELEEVACSEAGDIPLFEEALEALKGTRSGDLNALIGNAKRAKQMKQGTVLQKGMLCYKQELKDELKSREDSEAMIFDVRNPGPHFLDNFVKNKVLTLRGVHCERRGDSLVLLKTTFRRAMEEPAGKGKPPLYLLKTLIFNGVAGGGKTEFVHGVARECCKRTQKDAYSMASSLCPLGIMTKSGRIKDLGAICFEDFEMRTRGGTHYMTREERKSLLYVKQRAHYHAFYHQAILPEFVARMWSVNYGKDKDGLTDKTEWFATNGLEGLRLLAEGDVEKLNEAEEHVKAEARRAVIFFVDEQLFPAEAEGATDAIGVKIWRAEMENATPMD